METGIVTFYDAIAKTETELYFVKEPKKDLMDMEGSVTACFGMHWQKQQHMLQKGCMHDGFQLSWIFVLPA